MWACVLQTAEAVMDRGALALIIVFSCVSVLQTAEAVMDGGALVLIIMQSFVCVL